MTCDAVGMKLALLFYGELSFEDEELVHQHLEICAHCQAEFSRFRTFSEALDHLDSDVDPMLLARNRSALRGTVQAVAEQSTWWGSVSDFFRAQNLGWRGVWWKPAGAFALLALGFVGGRFGVGSGGPEVAYAPSSPGPVASRVRYLEPNSSGNVDIVVEETSQRTLSGATKDEPIRRLLLSAARDSADPGVRVESMEILKASAATTEVRHALIYALEHDSNPGVRLKALEGLKDFAQERETRKALTQALLADNNPGIRTQAIDLLVQNKEPAMVGVLQELMQKEDNNYVRLRCRKALLEMNASAEPF